jgi:hypothetical protein
VTTDEHCRACLGGPLEPVIDLGEQPDANRFPGPDDLSEPDPVWPLTLYMCGECGLLQLGQASPFEAPPPLHPQAPSATIAAHGRAFVDWLVAAGLTWPGARVVELASHGGHLSPAFHERGIATETVRAVDAEGQPISDAVSFGRSRARELLTRGRADLIVDNYLLAHVADPADMVAGLAELLAPGGSIVLEMDHLLPIVEGGKFDSFRHGHFIYPSLSALGPLFARHGLAVRDAQPQSVYGGTLRLVLGSADGRPAPPAVDAVLAREHAAGLADPARMREFGASIRQRCADARQLLAELRTTGLVAAYGAPSRGSTFLNACGLTARDIAFTVDVAPAKQGRYMPKSRVPIRPPSAIAEAHPGAVLVLTWDLRNEVNGILSGYVDGGGRLVYAIPKLEVVKRPTA